MPSGKYKHKIQQGFQKKNKFSIGNKHRKGISPWNKDKKDVYTSKTLKKMSKARTGFKISEETRTKLKKRIGDKSSNWKNGISKDRQHYCRKYRIRKLGNGGSHTLIDWETLKAQCNWICPCCGKKEPEVKLTEDHIIPLIKGGSDNIENIQPLCRSCNSRKHTKIIKYKSNYE